MGQLRGLRQTRRECDVTQAALAAKAGLSRSYVINLERGMPPSDPQHVRRLAEALNVAETRLLRRRRVINVASLSGRRVVDDRRHVAGVLV